MFKKSTQIKALSNQVKLNTTKKIAKLKLQVLSQASEIGADLITNALTILFALLAFIFITLTIGFLFSEFAASYFIGFGGLTLFYILIAFCTRLLKQGFLERLIMNFTIGKYFKKYEKKEDA